MAIPKDLNPSIPADSLYNPPGLTPVEHDYEKGNLMRPSTFSIVAYDPAERAWGIAVASKFPAVGAVVPWARAGAGAVATQAFANTSYGPRGLEKMAQGLTAQEALEQLLKDDAEQEQRQVGLVDAQGNSATFTGSECFDWAGGLTGEHFCVQGNILVGEAVVHAMAQTFATDQGAFPQRLYQALLSGDRAGGDRRGRQSAAIYIAKQAGGYGGFTDRWIDYRVDDHPDPVLRLGELLDLHELYFSESAPEERVLLAGPPLQDLQRIMQRLGYYQGEVHGRFDPATRQALEAFVGNENFEERTFFDEGTIDAPVLEYLTRHFREGTA